MIQTKTYPIKDLYLSKGVVSTFINKFWDDTFSSIKELSSKHLMLLVKVEFSDSELGYRTLGHLRSVNFEDREQFVEYITERLSILNESYTSLSVGKISFTYIIKEGEAVGTRVLLQDISNKDITNHRFNNMNLPITMNPFEYGQVIATERNVDYVKYIVRGVMNRIFEIVSNSEGTINKVIILGASDLKWTDTLLSGGVLMREIQKSTIYFLDGEVILRKQLIPGKPFKNLQVEKFIRNYFVTIDIETIKKNNQLVH